MSQVPYSALWLYRLRHLGSVLLGLLMILAVPFLLPLALFNLEGLVRIFERWAAWGEARNAAMEAHWEKIERLYGEER